MGGAQCLFHFKAAVHSHNTDTGQQTTDRTKLLQYSAFVSGLKKKNKMNTAGEEHGKAEDS